MPQVDKRGFGQRVARRRDALGMSQDALAAAIGMKQQGVANIELGVVARPRLLRELAATLRTTEDWLLWRRGPEEVEGAPPPPSFVSVPLLSWVSAGRLADAGSQIPVDDVPLLAFADLGPGEFFALRVEGDSMDRYSPPGSIIAVNREEREPINGKCYVFAVRGETTYKRWNAEPPYLAPHSTNPEHAPLFIRRARDLAVVGRVRRTVLDL